MEEKKMPEIKAGTRVTVKGKECDWGAGTVRMYSKPQGAYLVEFDHANQELHDADGLCYRGKAYLLKGDALNILEEPKECGEYGKPDPRKNWTLVLSCVNGVVGHWWRCEEEGYNTGTVGAGFESMADAAEMWAKAIRKIEAYRSVFGHPEETDHEPRYANGKAVYTGGLEDRNGEAAGFTIGKSYDFLDGKCRDDDGDTRPYDHRAGTEGWWFRNHFVLRKE